MRDIDMERILEYAVEDVDITLQLHQHFQPQLISDKTINHS